MLPYRKIISRQLPHLFCHLFYQRITVRNQSVHLIGNILQFVGNIKFQIKYCSLQSNHICSCFPFIHSEKLKVSTKVKNIKLLLILAIQQARAESCSTSNHLPEFRLTHHLFEKHQVQHLRHINTGIQHIHRDCNLRHFFRI